MWFVGGPIYYAVLNKYVIIMFPFVLGRWNLIRNGCIMQNVVWGYKAQKEIRDICGPVFFIQQALLVWHSQIVCELEHREKKQYIYIAHNRQVDAMIIPDYTLMKTNEPETHVHGYFYFLLQFVPLTNFFFIILIHFLF